MHDPSFEKPPRGHLAHAADVSWPPRNPKKACGRQLAAEEKLGALSRKTTCVKKKTACTVTEAPREHLRAQPKLQRQHCPLASEDMSKRGGEHWGDGLPCNREENVATQHSHPLFFGTIARNDRSSQTCHLRGCKFGRATPEALQAHALAKSASQAKIKKLPRHAASARQYF